MHFWFTSDGFHIANFPSGFLIPYSADIEGQNLILSAKHSLINSASDIPSEILQMHPGAVVHVIFYFSLVIFAKPLMANSADSSFLLGLYLQHHRSWLFCPLSWTFDWFLSQGQSKKFFDSAFLSFLKRMSNFSCFTKAVDRRVEKLSDVFYVGQSVQSHILSLCLPISWSIYPVLFVFF